MSDAAFIEFLHAEIDAGNRAWVEQLLAAARAKIIAGGGQIAPVMSGSVQGKSFSRELVMDAARVAACCRMALASDAESASPVPSTMLDFSSL